MKNNNVINVDSKILQEDKKMMFDKKLGILKKKVLELRESGKNNTILELEVKDLANSLVKEFRDEKVELGKMVSWINDSYKEDELGAILIKSINSVGSTMVNTLDTELGSIPVRLKSGITKPELYSDERVTNLVNLLNTYDNFIETFESIDLTDDSNCLDKNKYLISHDLHNVLINGYKISRDRRISKEEKGIYIVVFKSIKIKDKDVLIYKYIKYPYIFFDCLYSYIIKESSSLIIFGDKSVGSDYIFTIENIGFDKDKIISEIKLLSEIFRIKSIHSDSRGIYPRNIMDLFKMLLQGCPVLLKGDSLRKFIKDSVERNYINIVEDIVKLYNFYINDNTGMEMLKNKLQKPKLDSYNFLGRVIFVTEDLDSLIKNLQIEFNGVNQGPQPWRGQSDSLSHTIHAIDSDFRRSMNRHNQYHVNMGNIPRNSLIGRSKFSYQNIHLNIGNVRWYSKIRKYSPTKKYDKPVMKDNSSIYYELGEYIKNSPINAETQLKIENALWEHSYISLTEKLSKDKPLINYNLISNKFSNLLIQEKPKLIDYINRSRSVKFDQEPVTMNEYIQYILRNLLNKLSDDFIIGVIYGRLFKIVSRNDYLSGSNTVVDVFVDIANDLIGNYFYILYMERKEELKDESYKLADWKEENSVFISKFDDIKGEIGGRVITWLKNIDLVWIKLVIKGKKEKEHILLPTDRVLNVISKEDKIKPLPRRLPMIVRPNNYSRVKVGITEKGDVINKEILGGYLLNGEKYTEKLMIDKWIFGKSSLINDNNIMYDLVNNISSVGYKVNKDVFDFLTVYGFEYELLMDPKDKHPLMDKEKLTKIEHIELSSYLSKLGLQENILGLADVLLNIHEFFIPVRVDTFGRLYCISEYLNYQSTELAKSLLLFSKGEKLDKSDKVGISYLKAYGANCFGNKLDKKSWNDRIKWVDDNLDGIINFHNGNLIKKAEKKLLFIAFCFEYNRFLKSLSNEQDDFITYLPIQLDGTCNGYQHLSLLSLDRNLANEVNLTKASWDDEPKDFYSFTATRLINYFQDKLKDNDLTEKERETCIRISNITIARKIVKRAIMTIIYNVSHLKIIKYLQENFIECDDNSNDINEKWYYFVEDFNIKLKGSDFPLLASGLKEILKDRKFKWTKLLKYLNESARVCTKLGLFIPWKSPSSGVHVNQSYLVTKETRLKVFSYTKKTFSMKIADRSKDKNGKFKYNKSKQIRAFMPNLIHSLDADALALLVYYYFTDNSSNIKNIYTIHDCFAVTANNTENLINFLKVVYQKIYTERSYLKELHKTMIEHIKLHYNDDCIDENLYINTEPYKGYFPNIDDIVGKDDSKGFIEKASYLLS